MTTISCPQCQEPITLYAMDEAAAYLGCSLSNVKYHVHAAGNLKPARLGNTLFFTEAQLDQFQANRRPVGRPSITKEE